MKESFSISIIIPVYKSEGILQELINEIHKVVDLNFKSNELIFVDDGSDDNSWKKIITFSKKYESIKGIKLSRNFGQHYAILAGLNTARGEKIIVMDCDLQDSPKYIPEMINQYNNGSEIIFTIRKNRKFNFLKNFSAFLFYKIYNFLLQDKNLKVNFSMGSYTLFSKKVLKEYLKVGDYRRHHVMVLKWLGFKTSNIIIEHESRSIGKSGYNFFKLLDLAIDTIIFNSNRILNYFIITGLLISFIAFLGILTIIINSFFTDYNQGWPSIFIMILFSLGLIIFCIGIVGLYIGKMFDQTKNRQKFIIEDIVM